MSSNDDRTVRLAGVRERLAEFEMWRPFSDSEGRARALGAIWENAPADLALLLALVDEQAAEIAEARRALYRIMQACGIQGEASPERLADLDPAMCGEAAAKSIEDAWRLARERAAEIARLTRVCDESAAHYTAALDRVQAERDALSLDGSRLRAEKAEQAAEIERLRGALAGAQEAGREAQESLAECNARLDHEARMEAAAESRGAERERARLRALAQERAARLPLEAEDIERVFAPEEGARGEGEAKACHWFTAAAPAYPCESCGCPYTEHALDARSRGVPRG
jgi:chromosome segregation ATPase